MSTRFAILVLCSILIVSCTPKLQKDYTQSIKLHRKQIKENFINDPRAPLKTDLQLSKLDYFPPDLNYKIECEVEILPTPDPLIIPTYSGVERSYAIYALATCPFNEKKINLQLYRSEDAMKNPLYRNHLFLPFKDDTSGDQTYGGGRYLDLRVYDIIDGRLTIDFNKAYNPWCAYSDGYNCPIPPKENHIPLAISAGEKNYKGEYIYKK